MRLHRNQPVIARTVALAWGFSFTLLFRYVLDRMYPFFSAYAPLSLFAYLFVFLVFFSFWRFFHHHKGKRRKGVIFSLVAFANSCVFLAGVFHFGEERFLHYFPFLVFPVLLLQIFLFSAKLPFFIPQRLYLIAGIIPGLLPIELLQNPWIIFPISTVLAVFPNRFLHEEKLIFGSSMVRMLPLRQVLDFLRFLFLGFSLFGIFDIWRSWFFPVAGILIAGALLQQLTLRLDQKKHHIRSGMRLLAALFILLAFAYLNLPFPIFAALGYGLLAVWEAFYFKKAVEGYLGREQKIILLCLIICLAAYFITYEWSTLIFGAIAIVVQLRILLYVANRYRLAFALLFGLSFLVWGFGLKEKVSDTFTRKFFAVRTHHTTAVPRLSWLLQPTGTRILTNSWDEEVLSGHDGHGELQVEYTGWSAITAPLRLYFADRSPSVLHLIQLNALPPYNRNGKPFLLEIMDRRGIGNVVLFETDGESVKIIRGEKLVSPAEKSIAPDPLRSFGVHLAEAYGSQSQYVLALSIYEQLLVFFPEDAALYRQAARVAAAASNGERQIGYLEKAVKLSGETSAAERRQLAELYLAAGDFKAAMKTAEDLLSDVKKDDEQTLEIYRLMYQIHRLKPGNDAWRSFQREVSKFRPAKESPLNQDRDNLLLQIQEQLERNPDYYELLKKTRERQEKMSFPD